MSSKDRRRVYGGKSLVKPGDILATGRIESSIVGGDIGDIVKFNSSNPKGSLLTNVDGYYVQCIGSDLNKNIYFTKVIDYMTKPTELIKCNESGGNMTVLYSTNYVEACSENLYPSRLHTNAYEVLWRYNISGSSYGGFSSTYGDGIRSQVLTSSYLDRYFVGVSGAYGSYTLHVRNSASNTYSEYTTNISSSYARVIIPTSTSSYNDVIIVIGCNSTTIDVYTCSDKSFSGSSVSFTKRCTLNASDTSGSLSFSSYIELIVNHSFISESKIYLPLVRYGTRSDGYYQWCNGLLEISKSTYSSTYRAMAGNWSSSNKLNGTPISVITMDPTSNIFISTFGYHENNASYRGASGNTMYGTYSDSYVSVAAMPDYNVNASHHIPIWRYNIPN